jgi:nucleoside-diphosphate-sugar epimerase
MTASKTILVTGATGFLGRHLCNYFRKKGCTVRGLVRRTNIYPFSEAGITLFKGNLPDEIDAAAFEGVDVVVHAAYYTARLTSMEEAHRVNHDGTMRVHKMSKDAGVGQFVFISSTGSHAEAESYYGRSKYELEKQMDLKKDLIIRSGLIIGPGEDGTFDRMKESLRKSGVVPIFDGGHQILQTIHVDDLCKAIDLAIEKKLTGTLVVAEPKGLEMRDFFKLVSAGMKKKCKLVPLPMGLFLVFLRIIEKMHLPFPLSSENLLGLKQMKHMPSVGDLAKIGLNVKSAEQSLEASI